MDNESAQVGQAESLGAAEWKRIIAKYRSPNLWKALWQVVNTIGTYIGLWVLMYFLLPISWLLAILLAALAGGFLVRTFIIFHDCGHGSFFRSRTANDLLGFFCGVLTFTPYYQWRGEHALHHKMSGDLDRRGAGDLWTMTVEEYLAASRWKRFSYRFARNPIVLFVLAPIFVFVVLQRFSPPKATPREKHSVWVMNLAVALMAAGMVWIYGLLPYVILQGTIMAVGGSFGIWLFYVQHQFEEVYWERGDEWDFLASALRGSSFYKLPAVLQWFSGNIGFHHVHHLSPRIPNYNLAACHRSHPVFRHVKPVTLLSSLRSLTLRLWDESAKKLVGFRYLRELRRKRARDLNRERDRERPSG